MLFYFSFELWENMDKILRKMMKRPAPDFSKPDLFSILMFNIVT